MMIDSLRRAVLTPPVNSERFHVVFMDENRAFLGDASLGAGSICGLSLRLRELFRRGLSLGARGMILAHNHPSGDCRPSAGDVEATQRVAMVARALEIELVDHLIFTKSAVYSMRGRGEL